MPTFKLNFYLINFVFSLHSLFDILSTNIQQYIGMPEIMCRKHLFDAEAASVADDDDYDDDDADNKNNS